MKDCVVDNDGLPEISLRGTIIMNDKVMITLYTVNKMTTFFMSSFWLTGSATEHKAGNNPLISHYMIISCFFVHPEYSDTSYWVVTG